MCSGAPSRKCSPENPETVAAVVLESVTGANGVIVPPEGYLRSIREVCDRYGILLVLDEVMAGFGRTGRWFACEHWEVVPDILTLAKGINSGYVPLGAMVISEQLSDWIWDRPFQTGLTTSGHPIACASGVASIETLRDEGLVEHAAALGETLGEELRGLAERHEAIGDIAVSGSVPRARLGPRSREPLDARPVAKEALAAAFTSSCAATSCWLPRRS